MNRRHLASPYALSRATAAVRPMSDLGYGDSELVWHPDRPTSKIAYRGAPQTIEVMIDSALSDQKQFETRQLAEVVCERIDSKDYVSEYLALYNFLLQRTRYMRDPRRTELVRAPYVVSRMILAGHRPSLDCDDMATWLAAAVLAVGGTAWFATVAFARMHFQGQVQFSHVFTDALEPRSRGRIVLDPVAAEKTPEMLRRVKVAKLWGPLN